MGAFRSTPLRTALVLVASVLLLAASLSLLAVTAHAWLSDTVTNENNTITTGGGGSNRLAKTWSVSVVE